MMSQNTPDKPYPAEPDERSRAPGHKVVTDPAEADGVPGQKDDA